ncbi:tetratricopeptide repeat protein [bacterium]|nr:tetratricopeptide repeat protein [bacterium]
MTRTALDICRSARETGLVSRWDHAPDLGALLATGPDVPGFLQSQLTCNVPALEPGSGTLAARLNRKGALVAAFSLHRLPNSGQPFPAYLMILPATEIAGLHDDLERSRINEDVLLEEATGDFEGWVLQGPAASRIITQAWGETHARTLDGLAPEASILMDRTVSPRGTIVIARSCTGDPGFLFLVPKDAAPVDDEEGFGALLRAARACGAERLSARDRDRDAWHWLRVETGWPLAGRDYEPGRRALPQLGIDARVVSNVKGCYLGQEVVARIRAYGSVPEVMRGLVFVDLPPTRLPDFPAPGRALRTSDGERIGTWATGGLSVAWQAPVALAYFDRTHRTPGLSLTVELGGGPATAEVAMTPLYSAGTDRDRAEHLHAQAVRMFSHGRDEAATALLEAALRLDPARVESMEALGGILGRAGRYHEAIDVFKRLEESAPDEPMIHTNLSIYYLKLGDKVEAERQMALATRKRLGVSGDGDGEAEIAHQREEATRKRAMFDEVLALDPEDPLALAGLGNALLNLEDFAAAEDCFRRACAVQADNSPLYASHGRVLERLGRTQEAAETYRLGVEVASRRGDLLPLKEMEHRLLMLGDEAGR